MMKSVAKKHTAAITGQLLQYCNELVSNPIAVLKDYILSKAQRNVSQCLVMYVYTRHQAKLFFPLTVRLSDTLVDVRKAQSV